MNYAKRVFGDEHGLTRADDPMEAFNVADGLVWREFRSPDLDDIKDRLRQPLVFDGRNPYEPAIVEAAGIKYFSISRLSVQSEKPLEKILSDFIILCVSQ